MNEFTSAVASLFSVGRTLEFTLDDVPALLTPEDAAAVRALARAARETDGVAPLSEQPLLWLEAADAPVRHVLARASGSTNRGPSLLGYAQLDLGGTSRASAELVVHPYVRRRGIGVAMLSRVQHLAQARGRMLALWAHGDLTAARRLGASRGLSVTRELWRMGRPLPADLVAADLDAGATPAGVTVRDFVPGQDEAAWVQLNARVFASHPEQGRVSLADVSAREREPWFDPRGFALAESDGELVGYCWTKVPPQASRGERTGEIYVLGVDESARGTGLGRWLLRDGLRRLAAVGVTQVELYLDGDNEAAKATYLGSGFSRLAADVQMTSV
ncbi:mycothiol synthase [Luteimicrobium subarcticum]|uniref:Mycothiol acetyltransferase n=1 Tax=Luteimicrobium subarcticum TaxID=620910 RepID=A0A2M8WSE5_9MICO|nr:mycothiol synthase [Luteimicrobium subarcticum]PJI93867.1 mycothiol synthase [Luteimicrobium subarcticum]